MKGFDKLIKLKGGNNNLTYLIPHRNIVIKRYRLPLEYMIREVNFFQHCQFTPAMVGYDLEKKELFMEYVKEARFLTVEDFFSNRNLIDEVAIMLKEFHTKNPARIQSFRYTEIWKKILNYLLQKGERKLVRNISGFSFRLIDKQDNFSYVYGDLIPQNIIMTMKKPHKKFFLDGENGPFIKSLDSIGNQFIDVAYFIGWLISSVVYRPATGIVKGNEKDKLLAISSRFFEGYKLKHAHKQEKSVLEFLVYLFTYHLSYHYLKTDDNKKGYPREILEYYRNLIPIIARCLSIEKLLDKTDKLLVQFGL